MKIKSALLTSASGSIGGMTAASNRGGMYLRARTKPVNPNTARQQLVRQYLGQLSNTWSLLTQAQRDSWNLYASSVAMTDSAGATIKISGQNHYIRSNAPRLQAGLAVVSVAPSVFDIGPTPVAPLPYIYSSGDNSFGFSVADATAGDYALLYIGRPRNPGVSYFRGPYRFAGKGLSTAGTVAVLDTALPYGLVAGQVVSVRLQVAKADGRLSADAQGTATVEDPV